MIKEAEFRIERADTTDYHILADIIWTVWDGLDKKEWFVADNAEYIYEMLQSGKGTGYKAVAADTGDVAGVFLTVMPGIGQPNLGYAAGLEEKELILVAHMDSVAILPQYRGHKLQYRLMQAAEEDLRKEGFKYLMCTVHPDNYYSKNNIVSLGYGFVAKKEMYGGYVREIFLKRIEKVKINSHDMEEIESLASI